MCIYACVRQKLIHLLGVVHIDQPAMTNCCRTAELSPALFETPVLQACTVTLMTLRTWWSPTKSVESRSSGGGRHAATTYLKTAVRHAGRLPTTTATKRGSVWRRMMTVTRQAAAHPWLNRFPLQRASPVNSVLLMTSLNVTRRQPASLHASTQRRGNCWFHACFILSAYYF